MVASSQLRAAAPIESHTEVKLADRTYEYFCSRREIAEAASAPHGVLARYPGPWVVVAEKFTRAEWLR
jgi:hypothetical protein